MSYHHILISVFSDSCFLLSFLLLNLTQPTLKTIFKWNPKRETSGRGRSEKNVSLFVCDHKPTTITAQKKLYSNKESNAWGSGTQRAWQRLTMWRRQRRTNIQSCLIRYLAMVLMCLCARALVIVIVQALCECNWWNWNRDITFAMTRSIVPPSTTQIQAVRWPQYLLCTNKCECVWARQAPLLWKYKISRCAAWRLEHRLCRCVGISPKFRFQQ